MDTPFNRRDIGYTIASRFEESLRGFLADKISVLFANFMDGIPTGIIEKTKDRTAKSHWDGIRDFLDDSEFPDLKDIVGYNNMHKQYFSNSELDSETFCHVMDELYSLRCKIAHVRGYFTSLDLDKLLENTKKIAKYLEQYGKEFYSFVEILEQHPEQVVIPMPMGFTCDYFKVSGIPNNIPIPDYEYEGGFVGREEDIKKVSTLLEGDRYPVVTVAGAGGVGKTALVQRVMQRILEKSAAKKFDGVVWVSAKETKLSYLGIEDIEPTIKTFEQLLDTISDVLGFGALDDSVEKKEADVQTIFDLHSCILIVIDNLETIADERIINFIIEAHPKRRVLITSRKGLGQLEIRHELKQLKEKEAVYLFRQIARDKGLEGLAKLDNSVIESYVRKVSCYPLAIKWMIGQVAKGKDIHYVIDSINEKASDISRFCFEQIYAGLTNPARKIICALSIFDESPSAGVLNYVVNLSGQEEFEDGIQELILVSFVIPEQYKDEQGAISTKYNLLSLTRGYVRQQLDKDSVMKREIEDRLRSVQSTIEEAERAKKQYKFSLANLGATTEEEKVAAMIAQTAFQKYQTGAYADALEEYKRATEIAPHFASIYRNWAVMESLEGHSIEADKLMEKAVNYNKKDPQIWLTWGNMKRRAGKIEEALERYTKAFQLSPDDYIILNALGQAKCRLGEHVEADNLFKKAFQKEQAIGSASRKHKIINLSSLAENLKRWSEVLIKDRNYGEAEKKLAEALKYCEELIVLDENDPKSIVLLQEILIQSGYFYKNKLDSKTGLSYFLRAIIDRPSRFKEAFNSLLAAYQAAKIFCENGQLDKAREILTSLKIDKSSVLKEAYRLKEEFETFWQGLFRFKDNAIEGKITRVNDIKNFAIIESITTPRTTYYARIFDFVPKPDIIIDKLVGKMCEFIPTSIKTEKGINKVARFIILKN